MNLRRQRKRNKLNLFFNSVTMSRVVKNLEARYRVFLLPPFAEKKSTWRASFTLIKSYLKRSINDHAKDLWTDEIRYKVKVINYHFYRNPWDSSELRILRKLNEYEVKSLDRKIKEFGGTVFNRVNLRVRNLVRTGGRKKRISKNWKEVLVSLTKKMRKGSKLLPIRKLDTWGFKLDQLSRNMNRQSDFETIEYSLIRKLYRREFDR